jgi:diguanylate cyclase (GGDEF)-like protein
MKLKTNSSMFLQASLISLTLFFLAIPFAAQTTTDKLEAQLKNATAHKQTILLNDLAAAHQNRDPKKAMDYAQKALAQARQDKNEAEEARALVYQGEGFLTIGKSKDAMNAAQSSLNIAQKLGNKHLLAKACNLLGKVYRLTNNKDKALEFYNQALQISETNHHKSDMAESLNNLGILERDAGQREKALENQLKALKLRQELGDKQAIAASLNSLGISYKNLGDNHLALEYYHRALQIREEQGDKQAIAALLNNMGIVYRNLGERAKALEIFLRALHINEELGDKQGIAFLSNSLGNLYVDLGQNDKALEAYQRTLTLSEEMGDKKSLTGTLSNIGLVYQNLGKHEKALELQFKCLQIARETGDQRSTAQALTNIGSAYKSLAQYDKALDYTKQALTMQESLASKSSILILLENLGTIYSKAGRHKEGIENLNKALQLAESSGLKTHVKNIYNDLWQAYRESSDYKSSLESHIKLSEINREISSADSEKRLAELQVQYETEKKQKAIQLLTRDKQIQALELLHQQDSINQLQRDTEVKLLSIQAKEQELAVLERDKQIQNLELTKSQDEADKRARQIELLEKDKVLQSHLRNSLIGGFAFTTMLVVVIANLYRLKKKSATRLQHKNEEITRQKETLEQQAKEIERVNLELEEAALNDPLTGLKNRRFYSQIIGTETAKVKRSYQPESVLGDEQDIIFCLLDIDNFKQINDLYGHDAGDFVLVETACRLQSVIRKSDHLLRWGGEEFLALTHESKRTEGQFLAERLVRIICDKPFTLPCKEVIQVTVSVGWAAYPWHKEPSDISTTEEILRVADRALYFAKQTGKNRAVGVLPIKRAGNSAQHNDAVSIPDNLLLEDGKTIQLIHSVETLSLI